MTVYYTGIGSRKNGKHTKEQFLKIMEKTFIKNRSFFEFYGTKDYDPKILSNFTFKDWVKWSGAIIVIDE